MGFSRPFFFPAVPVCLPQQMQPCTTRSPSRRFMVPANPYGEQFVQNGVLTPAAFIAVTFNRARLPSDFSISLNAPSSTRASKLLSPMNPLPVRFCAVTSLFVIMGSALRCARRGELPPAGQSLGFKPHIRPDIHVGKLCHGYDRCQLIFSPGADPARGNRKTLNVSTTLESQLVTFIAVTGTKACPLSFIRENRAARATY